MFCRISPDFSFIKTPNELYFIAEKHKQLKMTDPLQKYIKQFKWNKSDYEIFKNTIKFKKGYRRKCAFKFYLHLFTAILVLILGILVIMSKMMSFTFFIFGPMVLICWACMGFIVYLNYRSVVQTYKERSALQMHKFLN